MKLKREIESFELTADYYIQSFANGNKSHVAKELRELYEISPFSCFTIGLWLPDEIKTFVFEGPFFKGGKNFKTAK